MRDLNLWKRNLGAVPDEVWDDEELETLVLADNGLTAISAKLGRLTKLRMLDLGHNKLAAVPDAIGNLELPRLEKVDVRWVQIDDDVLDRLEARGCLVYR